MSNRVRCCCVDKSKKQCSELSQKGKMFCKKHANIEEDMMRYARYMMTGVVPRENECDMCGGFSNPLTAEDSGVKFGYRCTGCGVVWQTTRQAAQYPMSCDGKPLVPDVFVPDGIE